jgi:hypothetical protein
MKFIGILNQHESGLIKIGRSLGEFSISETNEIDNINDIIIYLESGTILVAFLHWVNDSDNMPLCPMIIYTDGKWLYPSYLVHYLKRGYHSLLTNEFIDDIRLNKFIPPVLSKEIIANAERYYMSIYDLKRHKN